MNKLLWMALVLVFANFHCGGSEDSSLSPWGETTVTIELGETRTATDIGEAPESRILAIPPVVTALRFIISGPDMVTIQQVISTSGRTSVSESFQVPNGPARQFLAEALDSSGTVRYSGSTSADLEGVPISLTIEMVPNDTIDITPPIFSNGVWISATSPDRLVTIELSWREATDNVTEPGNIVYLIYMSTTSGRQDFDTPSFTTSPGVTSYTVVTEIPRQLSYYFVVRAKDEQDNISTNTDEIEISIAAMTTF